MKELFREADIIRVSLFQAFLEEEGIATMIRNQSLQGAGLNEIPIPEFYPALCVVNDADYGRATQIIRDHLVANQEGADEELVCQSCKEVNPGNFHICWSCERPLSN